MRVLPTIIETTILLSVASLGAAADTGSLMEAAKAGNVLVVRTMLERGVDPNDPGRDGTAALHWAAQNNQLDVVDLLIRAGAKVNAKNRYGMIPLALAVTNGNYAITKRLLEAGADFRAQVPGTGTVLLTAARIGNPDIIKTLLSSGADVNDAEPTSGQTALMWAATEGHDIAVKVLLAAGADIWSRSYENQTALFFAVRKGDISTVDALLTAGADVNERIDPEDTPNCDLCATYPPGTKISPLGDPMLVVAIVNGHFELADFLLNKGADPNAAGTRWSPLHALARVRNYEEAQYPAAVTTGSLNSLELAKRLLDHGANPNARATTMTAKRSNGDQNYVEFKGATPFLLAAKGADLPLMRLLLAAGADFTTPTYEHTTALMVAAGIGCVTGQWIEPERDVLQAVKLLVEELKVDVNAVNDQHETALHGAVYRGADSVVQYLVDKGAKLDARDAEGKTPLDIAVDGAHRPINIGGPRIILFRFPDHTAVLLRKLGAGHSHEIANREPK
jgi:ankyrin repeat protein